MCVQSSMELASLVAVFPRGCRRHTADNPTAIAARDILPTAPHRDAFSRRRRTSNDGRAAARRRSRSQADAAVPTPRPAAVDTGRVREIQFSIMPRCAGRRRRAAAVWGVAVGDYIARRRSVMAARKLTHARRHHTTPSVVVPRVLRATERRFYSSSSRRFVILDPVA